MSGKNFLTVNCRLEQTYQAQLSSLYRQHVSAMADWEHERLSASRLLTSIRSCPSDEEPLSVKFLGPPTRKKPSKDKRLQELRHQAQLQKEQLEEATQMAPDASDRLKPSTATRAAQTPRTNVFAPHQLERSKTFAASTTAAVPTVQPQPVVAATPAAPRSKRRQRTPLPTKLERFYTNLDVTKANCGLAVVDATQTEGFLRGSFTLSKADWLEKLARIDPEFFKNVQNTRDDAEVSEQDDDQSN